MKSAGTERRPWEQAKGDAGYPTFRPGSRYLGRQSVRPKVSKTDYSLLMAFCAALILMLGCAGGNESRVSRSWIGPAYWANPLQDWALDNGRIECVVSGGDRNLFWLTHELTEETGTLEMSVVIGALVETDSLTEGWVGFGLGKRGEFDDYRDNAVRGLAYPVGMTTDGRLFIGGVRKASDPIKPPFDNIRLHLFAKSNRSLYSLTLSAFDTDGRVLASTTREGISWDWMHGGVALVCSSGEVVEMPDSRPAIDDGNWGTRPGTERGGNVRFWFRDWLLTGSKVEIHPDRGYGPIMFNQYTLSRNILKMTAQMAPISAQDGKAVTLQVKADGNWQNVASSEIDAMARTAAFRIADWRSDLDVVYRLLYEWRDFDGQMKTDSYEGLVRKEPLDKEEIVVAGFTGNNDLGFPNNDILRQLNHHDPDVLFFSGDQLYEGVGGYGAQRSPLDQSTLDYLRKWYIYGWTYRDLLRDRPTVSITDDHDVYHGNIWGAGGKAVPAGTSGAEAQDAGGYKQPAQWVNMVQRTQTSHLPDPFDPTPVEQDIGVYYTNMDYGGVSFAILEDRKFKSAPKTLLPGAEIHNGWAQNPDFDPKQDGDVDGAVLLGDRQLNFLETWAADWSGKIWMKVVLSQTIFANVATLPRSDAMHDRIVPQLRILGQGEYAPDDIPVADMDSNGWPQSGRNRALRAMRKAFALNIAGDQHLGSTIQYGIDEWGDAGFAFCVPAVSNVWPRRWYPSQKSKRPLPGQPEYTGDYEDGFGNKMTVHAVSNPVFTGLKPSRLYDRATGYGIVRFNRKTRDITLECWPRLADPAKPDARQYPGWPITVNQLDNFGKNAELVLPTFVFRQAGEALIQVIDESNSEVVFTLRVKGNRFQPPVLKEGSYTVKVSPRDGSTEQIFAELTAKSGSNQAEITVE